MSLRQILKKRKLITIGLILFLGATYLGIQHWSNQVAISEQEVRTIVAEEVDEKNLTYAYLKLSREENSPHYQVKATKGNEVHILTIDADTGKILSTETDLITESEEAITTKGGYKCNCRPNYPRANARISKKEVHAILEKNTKQKQLVFTRFQLIQAIDDVDKPLYYEVEAYAKDIHYQYNIDATTGKVLDTWTEKI